MPQCINYMKNVYSFDCNLTDLVTVQNKNSKFEGI